MIKASKKKIYVIIFLIDLLLILLKFPSYSQSEAKAALTPHLDSLHAYPTKLSSKKPWEKVVDFPGMVIFLPFKIVFVGIEETVEYVDDSGLLPKIVEFAKVFDRPKGVVPKYSNRFGGGLSYYYKNLFNKGIKFDIGFQRGLKSKNRVRMRLRNLQLSRSKFSSNILVWYQFLSYESFFGIGNNSAFTDESNYAHQQTAVEFVVNSYHHEKTTVGFRIGFDYNSIARGRDKNTPSTTELFSEQLLPGLGEKNRIVKMKFELSHNGLNKPRRPSAGGYLSVGGGFYNSINSDIFKFWKMKADYRRYIHLFYGRTFVFRIAGETTRSVSDKKIPFYYLSELGEQETIRGFTRNRFRDRDMILGSLEYHYPIWRVLDAEFFIDAGQVSENIFKNLSKNKFHPGYGGSLSIWGSDKVIVRFTIGKSRDRMRYYLSINKDF
ncbi:BamA/TamA family outer membrane protein [candidate division KSB1 bacterium]